MHVYTHVYTHARLPEVQQRDHFDLRLQSAMTPNATKGARSGSKKSQPPIPEANPTKKKNIDWRAHSVRAGTLTWFWSAGLASAETRQASGSFGSGQ